MTNTFPTTEGFIPFRGYQVWYRIVGGDEEPGKLPLLVLHGGPGACHDYLEPLEAMARTVAALSSMISWVEVILTIHTTHRCGRSTSLSKNSAL